MRLTGGSSPRVRGILDTPTAKARGIRFIPAGAGNTSATYYFVVVVSVHPRGCGEYGLGGFHAEAVDRFIPAGAGNTGVGSSFICNLAVHPRGCGEYGEREA